MKDMKKCKLYMFFSVVMVFVSCTSICFSNIVVEISRKQNNEIPLYIVGGTFWVTLILANIFLMFAILYCNRHKRRKKRKEKKRYPGLICFFSNREAVVIDSFFIISILFVLVFIGLEVENSILILGSVFCTIFFMHLHGIINGRTYRYLKKYEQQKKRYRNERREKNVKD